MGVVKATGMLTIYDANDAIIAGAAPDSPVEGQLWIDTSVSPNVMKIRKAGAWVTQTLNLEQMDPTWTGGVEQGIENVTVTLGNMASDDKLTAIERKLLNDKLFALLGQAPPASPTGLPAVSTVNGYTKGEYYQARKAATDAGVSTSETAYTAFAAAYTTLANYLNGLTASSVNAWDIAPANTGVVHTVVGSTFRTNWVNFLDAKLALETLTAKRIAVVKDSGEKYAKSFRDQLVLNGYGDMGNNTNFSAFVYSSTEKVTGVGSFARTNTLETRTDEFIPIDTTREYRLSMQVKSSSTTGSHNLGIECYNAAGTSLGKRHLLRNGSGTTVIPTTTGWVRYEAVIGGVHTGAGTVTDTNFPLGTTQVKIWFNLNNSGTANTVYIADVQFLISNIETNRDYNGVNMNGVDGLTVTSARNKVSLSGTKGIEIIKNADPANPVFKVDSATGDLTITGNIEMKGGTIAWADVNKPTAAQVGAATSGDIATAVNGIQIGGRNLLLRMGMKEYMPSRWSPSGNGSTFSQVIDPVMGEVMMTTRQFNVASAAGIPGILKKDDVFVLSFYAKGNTSRSYMIRITDGAVATPVTGQAPFAVTPEWKKVELVLTAGNDLASNHGVYIYGSGLETDILYMTSIKLEKGTKATDWTPAIEDTQGQLDDFKTLTDKVGNTTVINGTMVQSGTVKGNFVDAKNLTVKNTSNEDTLKVDANGNVTIKGNLTVTGGNVYDQATIKSQLQNALNTAYAADIRLAMKQDFSTYTTSTADNLYFHGYNWNTTTLRFEAADVNGQMLSADNATFITLNRGRLNVSGGVPAGAKGYIVYDAGVYWFVSFLESEGKFKKYNVGVTGHTGDFIFTNTSYVIGEIDMGA